eukprot:403375492
MNNNDNQPNNCSQDQVLNTPKTPQTYNEQNDIDSSIAIKPNDSSSQAFQTKFGPDQDHQHYIGIEAQKVSQDVQPRPQNLDVSQKNQSLTTVLNHQGKSQTKVSPQSNQIQEIQRDKYQKQLEITQNAPSDKAKAHFLNSNLDNKMISKYELKNQTDQKLHSDSQQVYDISMSSSAVDNFIDQNDVLKISQKDAEVENQQDSALDNTLLSQENLRKRQSFFNEFVNAENFILTQGQKPSEEKLREVFIRNQNKVIQENYLKDNHKFYPNSESEEDQSEEYYSQNLEVLSNKSWYIHDCILYNLEIKEGLYKDHFFGYDQNIEDYIGGSQNQWIFQRFKNPFYGLKQFKEYNILEKDLNFDYSRKEFQEQQFHDQNSTNELNNNQIQVDILKHVKKFVE